MAVQYLYPSKDVHIADHSRGNWYMYQSGLSDSIWLGCWDWPEYANQYNFYAYRSRGLFKFDVPEFTAETSIVSVKLKVPLYDGGGLRNANNASANAPNASPTIDVHEILQDWDEGTGTGFIDGHQYTGGTWTIRKNGGWGWSATGGYINNTPTASATQNRSNSNWEFDITPLFNKWRTTPSSNFGLMLKYRNDHIAQGSFFTWSKQFSNGQAGPYLEVTYNTPPEKPRGLSPNFGSFICMDLSHTMEFKWNFIDVAAPPARGKTDVIFIIDVTSSMHWRLPQIRQQIQNYINRMQAEQVDYRVGLVAFGNVQRGEPIRKWGVFSTMNEVLAAYDSMPRLVGSGYMESGLEAIMDATNGALSFAFRQNSQVQFMICTDSPFHNRTGLDGFYINGSAHEVSEVVSYLNSRGIRTSMSTNTHCGSYTQLRQFPSGTNGDYLEESSDWGNYLQIKVIKSADEMQAFDEGDYQTRADLKIWKINPNGTRTEVWSYVMNNGNQSLFIKGLGVPWEEGASYEWGVVAYDKYGVPSQMSDKAKFTYIIDVNASVGIPMFNEPVVAGTTINKKALLEIRTKLYDEIKKYRNIDPAEALALFNGEVVPSRDDMTKLATLLNKMKTSDGLSPLITELLSGMSFRTQDVQNIRDILVQIAYSGPDAPPGGTARKVKNKIQRPLSIASVNDNALDTTLNVTWTPAYNEPGGWEVKLQPATDTDINYYKFYHETTINYKGRSKKMMSEVYIPSEQVTNGSTIFVPDTGRADAERMTYTVHDMNGRTATSIGNVTLNAATAANSPVLTISSYAVEYQRRSWSAILPDPGGVWTPIYSGTGTSFTHTVPGEGSYWYRVRAFDSQGAATDWTYSQDVTYVKF